jgi:exosortase/archaeosortase family protein
MRRVDESEPENPEAEAPAPTPRTRPPLWQDPWFRFAGVFGLLALISEVVYYAFALESDLFRKYLEVLAAMSAWILEQMTTGISRRGTIIHGDLFSVQIAPGCDAYRICALLGSAILAFPARWKTKAIGLFFGLLWLNALNFVRIVGLYFIGALYNPYFQDSHEVYFPIFLICMTIAAWMIWVRRATDDLLERQRNAS